MATAVLFASLLLSGSWECCATYRRLVNAARVSASPASIARFPDLLGSVPYRKDIELGADRIDTSLHGVSSRASTTMWSKVGQQLTCRGDHLSSKVPLTL